MRPTRPVRSNRRLRFRPILDRLEGRALMAYAGSLDPTFGGSGSGAYVLPLGSGSTTRFAIFSQVQVESDSSILVDGQVNVAGGTTIGLIHLKADGTPDTAFGTGGETDLAMPSGVTIFNASQALLVQPSTGQITLVLSASSATQSMTVVARLNANGSLDSSYGTGGYAVLTPTQLGKTSDYGSAALQTNGKVDLLGSETIPTTPGFATVIIAVAQLDATGKLDTGFVGTGVTTISDVPPADLAAASAQTPAYEMSEGLAIQPNGQVVILGFLFDEVNPAHILDQLNLIRLNADGSRDNSLSQVGILATGIDELAGLIIQPNGAFLVHGLINNTETEVVARVNANGSLDTEVAIPPQNPSVSSFALSPDGKIELVGYGGDSVSRLNADLSPDDTFGEADQSSFTIPLPPPPVGTNQGAVVVNAFAVGPDGRIVIVGSNPYGTRVGTYPPADLAVARLTATSSAHPGDFTGDGISDPAVYLTQTGTFAIGDSSGHTAGKTVQFGTAGPGNSIPAPGDYYGTGRDDIAVYLVNQGAYAIQDPTGQTAGKYLPFGTAGVGQTIPAPGDYDNTGQDDVAVYLTASGAFAIQDPTGKTAGSIIPFGKPGVGNSIPVPGDYDGSGHTELAVYVPSTATFYYRSNKTGLDVAIPFGAPGLGVSLPMPGDYDGSGKTEAAVYIPSTGTFYYHPSAGGPDVAIPFGTPGVGKTLPAPGDYNGSGHTELGVYLTTTGTLAIRPSSGGNAFLIQFGTAGFGNSIPVTTTVLPPFTIANPGSGNAIEVANFEGGMDPLLDLFATRKSKAGGHSA